MIHGDGISFQVGDGRARRHMRIRLNALDLYDVEVLKIRRNFEHFSEAARGCVHAEDLPETLLRLHDEVS